MAIKQTVTKIVNDIVERGIQMLTADPISPLDTQFWYDKLTNKLAIRANGSTRVLNVQVLSMDPLSSVDGQVWINSGTNQVKYQIGGLIFSASLGSSPAGITPSIGSYYETLTEVEIQNLSDFGAIFPNYVIDSFNAIATNAVYSGASPQGSALRLNGALLTGTAKYEVPTSTVCDSVDGIVIYTPNCWKPTTFVDNGDGTSTIVFAGDATGYFNNLKRCLIYYETIINGKIHSIYCYGGDNQLAVFNVIGAPVFAAGNTTVIINNSPAPSNGHVDVLAQTGVGQTQLRVYPLDLTVKVGGTGILGSQATILPTDAHGLDQLRTLGGDVMRIITSDLKENINKVAINYSPNRQFWMIAVVHTLPAPTAQYMEMVIYYSVDGLNTLNRMVPTYPMNESFTSDQFDNGSSYYFLEDHNIIVSDTGKFVFVHEQGTTSSTYQKLKIAYGDLTNASPVLIYIPAVTTDGVGIPLLTYFSNHWSMAGMALDPNDNYLLIVANDQQNGIRNDIWFKDGGATYMGTSDAYAYTGDGLGASVGWYMNLEGEQQAVCVDIANNNDYPQFLKKKISQIEAAYAATPRVCSSVFRLNPMFANESVSQPITAEGSCFHIGTTFDATKIHSWWWSDSNERSFMTEVHLEDVFVGTDAIQHIAFTATPASGQWTLQYGANTTSALSFSETAAQIQTKLQALASIGAGNALVTGDYIAGFNVHFTATLGKQPVTMLIVASNSLQDVTPAPVTVNITQPTPGVLPIYPHMLNQYRHLNVGVGDLVLLMGNRMDADYAWWQGLNVGNQTGYNGYFSRRIKKHPSDANRAFMAWQRYENIDAITTSVYLKDAWIMQMDHLDTYQGMFMDSNNGLSAAAYMGTTAGGNYGTELANLVTCDRNITLRAFATQNLFTWNNYPMYKPRGTGQFLRCKLVNITGGLPNEGSVIATSPTKHSIFDMYTGTLPWQPFRFDNVVLTSGQQFFAVLYMEGVNVATDWPTGAGEPGGGAELGWYGSGGSQAAVKQAGIWVALAYNLNFRMFDYFIDNAKTPDVSKYPKFDLTQPSYGFSAVKETQLEFVDVAKTQLQLSYRIGGDTQLDSAIHNNQGTILMRKLQINAADTFLTDLNTPNPTQMLGYDPATYDHNLVFHVRLSDPTAVPLDKFGNPRFASADHTFPILGLDYAGGAQVNWNATANMWKSNNLNFGHTQDARFKSGWATHLGLQGNAAWYIALYGISRADNFIYEFEICPSAADIVGYSGGLSMFACFGSGNGWYAGLQAGKPIFVMQNNAGPAFVSGSTTQTNTVLGTNEYCRLRFTREDDQLNHVYRWRNSIEGWLELPYTQQINFANKCTYNINNQYIYIGSYYNNTYYWDGLIGEVKLAIGATSFLNGDGIADQRPMIQHHNVGDRVLAKRQWSHSPSQISADGNVDDNATILSQAVFIAPQGVTGKVAGRDQLLKYRDLSSPQGNKLAATMELDRVSANAASAIQGFLLNYQKQ